MNNNPLRLAQPSPPPECYTEEEKTAYAFGWWKAMEAQRLAQPEQEPKCGAIIEVFGKDWRLDYMSLPVGKHKLYTQQYTYNAPPQRKPLSDEQIEREWQFLHDEEGNPPDQHDFARAIEAAHGIKENT